MIKNIKERLLSKLGVSCFICLLLSSCTLDIPLEDQYSDPDAIATVENARSLLTSAYTSFPHNEYDFSILGPDFCPTSLIGKDSETRNLYNWQDNTISRISQRIWLEYYSVIATCDVLQERLANVKVNDEEDKQELAAIEAESYTLEAMAYFDLLRLFAPAYDLDPNGEGIILKNRVGVEFPPRSPKSECVANIRGLLNNAIKVDFESTSNGWLSNTAAHYLLAELELYAGNYESAAKEAEQILEQADDAYFTPSGYESLWKPNSCDERIFGFNVTVPIYVSLQYDKDLGDYLAVSPEIDYAANDYRAEVSIYPFEMGGVSRNLLGKYNKNNKDEEKNSYINNMRYAGAYFIAAEAYSHLEGKSEKARTLINEYLSFCGADLIAEELNGDALTDAIIKEKLKEFVGEGILYFDYKRLHKYDLKRWNRWGETTAGKIGTNDYRWTFPIPATEYKYNEMVHQNEGWPFNR